MADRAYSSKKKSKWQKSRGYRKIFPAVDVEAKLLENAARSFIRKVTFNDTDFALAWMENGSLVIGSGRG